jgi:antitoxin MazE
MGTKIKKWGNSAAVRLSAATLSTAGLAIGDEIEFVPRDGVIELRRSRRIPSVKELFEAAAKMGPLVQPEIVDWGPDRGAEIIDDEYSRGEITFDDLMKDQDAAE